MFSKHCLRALASNCIRSSARSPIVSMSQNNLEYLLKTYSPSYQSKLSFTTSAATCGLINALKQEHEFELKNYDKPSLLSGGPPHPYTVSEAIGDTLVTLSRTYLNERIRINLHVNNQMTPDTEDGATSVIFNVQIIKEENSLVFECESDGSDFQIHHVSYEPKEGVRQESTFTGPVFDELDEEIKIEFKKFLIFRGINADLGEYLRFLVYDKEQKEYIYWLKNVETFVDK
uniref:Mitochondrial glycoprotein n=1 Tax=Polytomella parva TaxID=51329 RepID=A0A7S0YAP8_9CHLO